MGNKRKRFIIACVKIEITIPPILDGMISSNLYILDMVMYGNSGSVYASSNVSIVQTSSSLVYKNTDPRRNHSLDFRLFFQPSFHIPYIYTVIGKPSLMQYWDKLSVNGEPWHKLSISHDQLAAGAELQFHMVDAPAGSVTLSNSLSYSMKNEAAYESN